MKNKLLFDLLARKIKSSLGRFIAITLIILLGVMLFTGIKSSGPDLYHNADTYFKNQKLSDVQITSPVGVTSENIAQAKTIKNATVETRKITTVSEKNGSNIFQLYSTSAKDKLNQPKIVSGRMPKNSNEIILDQTASDKYNLNQEIQFENNGLKKDSYEIVGFVTSPLFINEHERPATTIGNGKVDFFAYLDQSQFAAPNAQAIYVKYHDLSNLDVYSSKYQDKVDAKISKLKTIVTNAPNTPEMLTLSFEDHQDLPGFDAYSGVVDRISVIANVFPMFFFLIAILITFTTMTRMVEEERVQIGTFKALGFKKSEISLSYYFYAIAAAIIGTVLGILIGVNTLPMIVMTIMQQMYIFPPSGILVEAVTIIIAVILSLIATVGAVALVMNKDLREKPANLMLPRAPAAGKRILLEKIQPLWHRFSFFQKISYRNLFRFKSRMWMGIIGIAGGAGLILTGFGITNSIAASGQRQYADVVKYQAIVTVSDMNNTSKVEAIFKNDKNIESTLPVKMDVVSAQSSTKKVNTVSMIMTDQVAQFPKYSNVTSAQLNKNGAVITDKLANLLNVKIGSQITVKNSAGQVLKIKIAAISKNYVGHYVYLNSKYFKELNPKNPTLNSFLVKSKKVNQASEKDFSKKLLATNEAININFISSQKQTLTDMVKSLDPIVIVFIVLSGLLTFVVLYNLVNINISERIRELSTIKVLGFFDREVTMYIVRENIVLTLLGILFGVIFGNILLWFILQQAMTEEVVFPQTISVIGYVTAVVLTIVFTAVVMLITHRKLKKVNMIDALKANE